MSLLLDLIKGCYLEGTKRNHFVYKSPLHRKPCDEIDLVDSQVFLGSNVLPGIPAILPDDADDDTTRKQTIEKEDKHVTFVNSILESLNSCFFYESKVSPLNRKVKELKARLSLGKQVLANALETPLLFLLKCKAENEFGLDLDFGLTPIRVGATKINTQLNLTLKPSGEFAVPKNCVHERVLCAAFTWITLKQHFLESHVLCVQTLYCLAAKHLSRSHPIYLLLHPHGYQVMGVNYKNGPSLLQESFCKQWSFTPKGTVGLMHKWQQEFALPSMSFPVFAARFKKQKNLRNVSHFYCLLENCWHVIEEYVSNWLQQVYQTQQEKAENDPELRNFWKALLKIPYLRCQTFTLQRLHSVISTYIYVAICYHQFMFREGQQLYQACVTYIPKNMNNSKELKQLLVSQESFKVVELQATKGALLLKEDHWISAMPLPFRHLSQEFQQKMISLDLELNLGINV